MLRLIICQNLKSDSLNAPYISIQEVHNLVGVFLPMFISFYKKDETDYSYNNKTWEENDGIRRCFIVHSILTRPPNSKIFGPALAWPYRRTILHLSYSLPTLCQKKTLTNRSLTLKSWHVSPTAREYMSVIHVRGRRRSPPRHTHTCQSISPWQYIRVTFWNVQKDQSLCSVLALSLR